MEFNELLRYMVEHNGSDMFITSEAPPSVKVSGQLKQVSATPLTAEQSQALAYAIMSPAQITEFESTHECNFAIARDGIGRFRINVFKQRNSVGLVVRKIETQIPSFDTLNLPPILKEVAMTKRGIVLFVGGTGSGKSTSLAAMIDYRNTNSSGHIVTIEDPIEFVHQHKGCIITQREVGIDTDTFESALVNTLRQAPDVILIGEIRHRETMEHAVAFAETGHLCLATLHANNANQALDRIINFFPEERRSQLLMDLSLNLKSVIAQRLVPHVSGKGRRAAIEILLNTPLMADLIHKGEVHQIKELMKKSAEHGMQTFDQAVFNLHRDGEISLEEALRNADSPNEVRLMVKLHESSQKQGGSSSGGMSFSLEST
ncbi:PilT/PilU family type 4a pilus ATPase [Chrysiogenes arsenatis]|uniref:PilT/PilU family type 4a pilus ATPase n=1 Tax=Chrysiogenes arsenatis TaxID=309797 RepID=UPI0004237247|nr:PilT/PilU family type 4a pilus ATPase [Chrysiogenes arsenatis]